MSFQLVRASDTEIAVWHTEHGHIYIFQVTPAGDALTATLTRPAPDAAEAAEHFAADALRFATGEAESRLMIRASRLPRDSSAIEAPSAAILRLR